jgi:hypothetical protein
VESQEGMERKEVERREGVEITSRDRGQGSALVDCGALHLVYTRLTPHSILEGGDRAQDTAHCQQRCWRVTSGPTGWRPREAVIKPDLQMVDT